MRPPLHIRGQVYDLAHLDSFQFEVSSTKVPRPLRINVRFTNYCFSEAFDATRHPADEPVITGWPAAAGLLSRGVRPWRWTDWAI